MAPQHDLFKTLQNFDLGGGRRGLFYSLPALAAQKIGPVSRLPYSLRIVLEAALRHCDGRQVTPEHVRALAAWEPKAKRVQEIPFVVSRVILQDYTGVPLVADLAAMREAAEKFSKGSSLAIEPLVPVDLVIDHSVQTDYTGRADALQRNMETEFARNRERYQFLKWGADAFKAFRVVPPGTGIIHQINLEYLAQGVWEKDNVYYPDTLVGADSHTTMINGLGVVGWGVGGIEAEAAMLGQPVYLLMPDVVGVHLTGTLRAGVTATDLVLTLTERLRKANVVDKFVEFFGTGAASLPVPDRATLANMAPDYGATMGFFAVDEKTLDYYRMTGRSDETVNALQHYFKAQGLFGIPALGDCDYTAVLEFDLGTVVPSVAGPKRPQDRIALPALKDAFNALFTRPVKEGGYGKTPGELSQRFAIEGLKNDVGHGDVMIASITSCTNTSNPSVLLAAGLLAKKAVEKGLCVNPRVKTSLAPGSRIVTAYLKKTGLQDYLDRLGFQTAAYGCATCIGNTGRLDPAYEKAVVDNRVVAAAVLSGNRNFEARIHPSLRANFLMSPPLVVAFALAGRVNTDLHVEPLGTGDDGKPVYLKDLWPTPQEIEAVMRDAKDPAAYRDAYRHIGEGDALWRDIPQTRGMLYDWDKDSTYIVRPPFFDDCLPFVQPLQNITGAKALAIFGDSITTDHISPAGAISPMIPAGEYLLEHGISERDFNNFGARRGNHEVMVRGTFSNVRIKNLMLHEREGGLTATQPDGTVMAIYQAAMLYREVRTPTIIFAGHEYGTGSSRDWAAKGPWLLGVRAVIAQSFERIHRSNLVGMGILPCEFLSDASAASLEIKGDETFDIYGLDEALTPKKKLILVIRKASGDLFEAPLTCRLDTDIEVEYFKHGGILPYMLRRLTSSLRQS